MKYPAYSAYKTSPMHWLGSVPSHWHVTRLKWSTTGCHNGVWGDEPNDLDDLVCIRVADFDRDQFVVVNNPPTIRAIEASQRRNRILQKNDLLIEKSGGGEKQLVGCVVQFTENFPAVCSNFVARLPIARGCDPRYFTYLHSAIYSARLNYLAIKQTTGIQNLDSSEYLNILATYPPLAEQETIARFLDAKTAQIDALVAQKRQLIDRLKEKRQALIARTVTRGLPPDAAVAAGLEPNPVMKDSGVDWLGQVPRHWHVDRLKWSTKGCYNGVWGDEPNEIDDLICVRVADFDRDRFIVISSPPTIRAIETGQRRNRILQKNDLLIEKSGGGEKQLVGCVVQFTEDLPAVCSNFVARLPVASGCNARYLTYLHSTIYAARLNYPAIKQTTGIQNLDSSEYLNISVAYPPIPEQAAIAAYLDAQSAQIDTLLAKTEAAITRLAEYRQALITSAVTGKIDVRGWAQQHKAGGKAFGAPNNTIKTEAAQAGLVA